MKKPIFKCCFWDQNSPLWQNNIRCLRAFITLFQTKNIWNLISNIHWDIHFESYRFSCESCSGAGSHRSEQNYSIQSILLWVLPLCSEWCCFDVVLLSFFTYAVLFRKKYLYV